MNPPKSALQSRIAEELSRLNASASPDLTEDCPERAWLNGAAWMADKITQVLEDQHEDAAALLKRTALDPICLQSAPRPQVKKPARSA